LSQVQLWADVSVVIISLEMNTGSSVLFVCFYSKEETITRALKINNDIVIRSELEREAVKPTYSLVYLHVTSECQFRFNYLVGLNQRRPVA
jgi:hypothetical protein